MITEITLSALHRIVHRFKRNSNVRTEILQLIAHPKRPGACWSRALFGFNADIIGIALLLIEAIYLPLMHSVFILLDSIPMIKRPQFEARMVAGAKNRHKLCKQPISPRIPPGPS